MLAAEGASKIAVLAMTVKIENVRAGLDMILFSYSSSDWEGFILCLVRSQVKFELSC